MSRVLVLVLLALVLAAPATSHATQASRALEYARAYWNDRLPPCGMPQVQRVRTVPDDWAQPAYAWAIRETCVIAISTPHITRQHYCGVIAHEWGHLLGKEHRDARYMDDRLDVMGLGAYRFPTTCLTSTR